MLLYFPDVLIYTFKFCGHLSTENVTQEDAILSINILTVFSGFVWSSRPTICNIGLAYIYNKVTSNLEHLYDIVSGSEITPCFKILKPLVVYHYDVHINAVYIIVTKWSLFLRMKWDFK